MPFSTTTRTIKSPADLLHDYSDYPRLRASQIFLKIDCVVDLNTIDPLFGNDTSKTILVRVLCPCKISLWVGKL